MTEQEAAKIIKRLNFCGLCTTGPCGGCERKQAKDTVLSTLEEIQKYRAIGTVEECQNAREKQRKKNAVAGVSFLAGYNVELGPILETDYTCPDCGCRVGVEYIFCSYCGQALNYRK
ncbi:MAG: hypothetical protein HFH88_14890 [Lachnospiraceae bacterium]|nr:hypothetical protein [Lachnospiraceae bacterium]